MKLRKGGNREGDSLVRVQNDNQEQLSNTMPDEVSSSAAVADEDETAAGVGSLATYKVNYRGGHPDYPKPKVSGLVLNLHPDRFEFPSTRQAKWFRGLTIPYADVRSVDVVARNVSAAEAVLGGLNSRQLNQDNNIHIAYVSGGREILLRLEMLTGVTVMGQAKKCREFMDRMRNLGILDQFQQHAAASAVGAHGQVPSVSTADELAKLADLHRQGVLTDEEFASQKTKLLGMT